MDWRHRAVCRDEDPELFFPVGNSGPALAQIADAKLVCNRCSVVTECLTWALESGQDAGVWGGMSEDERRALKRRNARTKARTGSDHSTTSVAVPHGRGRDFLSPERPIGTLSTTSVPPRRRAAPQGTVEFRRNQGPHDLQTQTVRIRQAEPIRYPTPVVVDYDVQPGAERLARITTLPCLSAGPKACWMAFWTSSVTTMTSAVARSESSTRDCPHG